MSKALVYIEAADGKIAPVSYELMGAARALGAEVEALVAAADPEPVAAQAGGADVVVTMAHAALAPYTPEAHVAALAAAVQARNPDLVLVGSTSVGIDLAAGVAAATGRPLVAYCLDLTSEGGAIQARSQVYGGKLVATTRTEGPAVFAVLPGAFPADAGLSGGAAGRAAVDPPAALGSLRTRFISASEPEPGVDITKAERLVAVGRGIGGPENLELAEELAQGLRAEIAASRPVVDSGWLPRPRQVGKSGMTVKPKLYLAVGISGAPEHLEGMRDAELIVAVNSDPNAPIFEIAHYGTTCDLFDLLPALSERLKAVAG